MCGIVGIVSHNNKDAIHDCMSKISHRGPDDSGTFIEGDLALGHHRLSIQDLSSLGHQPMQSNDGNFVLIFNGEIYNHAEIRKEIGTQYMFKSHSDTETILAGFQIFGTAIFSKLNGIFALAIYDRIRKRLTLARDHFGVKPLYYYVKDAQFFFGSEVKSFLPINDWDKTIDLKAIANYLHYLYSPGEQTPFKYVKKMPAGHFCEIDVNNVKKPEFIEYYSLPFNGKYEDLSEEEWIKRVDNSFSIAVERQLLSDVPVGYFLSGGLDSSLIVAKAKELTNQPLQCFTINTDINEKNEEGFTNDLFYAKKVAKHLDVKLDIVDADINIVDDFDKMIWHLDEPQADAAPLNVYNISKKAREMNHVVLLGGAGGDDLFSGYRRHQALNFEKYFKLIPNFTSKGIKMLLDNVGNTNANLRRLKKITKDLHLSPIDRMAGYYEWLAFPINKKLFAKEHQNEFLNFHPSSLLVDSLNRIPGETDALNRMLFWEMSFFLQDHNLNYTDKLSMATGVEVRVPYLDLDLVNMSTKIPTHLKMRGNTTKYILKKVAEKYLPQEVIYRPKTGFGAPVRKWILNDLDDMIHEYLSPEKIKERGIFDSGEVWKLIQQNKEGKVDASYSIWCLLAIESWMKQFLDYEN